MKKISSLLAACAVWILAFFGAAASAATVTGLFLAPSPAGSYVTQNQTWVHLEGVNGNTFYTSSTYYPGDHTFWMQMLQGQSFYWDVEIRAPYDTHLTIGSFVGTRFPFQEKFDMGVSVTGNGRGSNTSTSFTNVLEANYFGENIVNFAADIFLFEETWDVKEGLNFSTDRALFASVRYNSHIPLTIAVPIPEPGPTVFVIIAVIVIGVVVFRKRPTS